MAEQESTVHAPLAVEAVEGVGELGEDGVGVALAHRAGLEVALDGSRRGGQHEVYLRAVSLAAYDLQGGLQMEGRGERQGAPAVVRREEGAALLGVEGSDRHVAARRVPGRHLMWPLGSVRLDDHSCCCGGGAVAAAGRAASGRGERAMGVVVADLLAELVRGEVVDEGVDAPHGRRLCVV